MKLDGIWMKSIELDKIVPIYIENVSKRAVEKMVKILEGRYRLSNHVIVEKDRTEDKYWLVAGFPEYLAYKKMNEKYKRYTKIFCVIRRYSNETEQRIKLLRRMFYHQTTKWLDKHMLIDQMVNSGVQVATIARKLGVTQADIENYFVHPDIPFDIIKQARENQQKNTSKTSKTMERNLNKVMSFGDFKELFKKTINEHGSEIKDLVQQEEKLTNEIYTLFFNKDENLKDEIIKDKEYNCPLTGKRYKNLKSMLKHAIRFKLEKMVHQAKEEMVANDSSR